MKYEVVEYDWMIRASYKVSQKVYGKCLLEVRKTLAAVDVHFDGRENLPFPLATFSIEAFPQCHGHGKKILELAVQSARKARLKGILGIVDLLEDNPFDLTEWYQRRGFQVIGRTTVTTYSKYGLGYPVIWMDLTASPLVECSQCPSLPSASARRCSSPRS